MDSACGKQTDPPRRVVLLGASNLTRAFAAVVRSAIGLWGGPLDIMAAIGHGRSYGMAHTLFWRELPGIFECGLWSALRQRSPLPLAALVTDIGNDIVYDVPVQTIAEWVDECLHRLQQAGGTVAMTALPLCSIQRLSPARYVILRTLVFPGCRLSYDTVTKRARDLDDLLHELARTRGVALIEHQPSWYGFDPIHLRRGCWPVAWRQMLALAAPAATHHEPIVPHRIRPPSAERRRVFGRQRYTPQPGRALADGSPLSLY